MNQAKLVIAILTLAGSFLARLVSIVIIALIIQKVSLHRVRFYIMINLCITNIVTLLMVIFGIIYSLSDGVPIKDDKMNIASSIVGTVTTITHINSMLTAAFLSIDRYIAVKHSIHYQNILTVLRMFYVLIAIRVLSTVVAGIQWLNVRIYFHYYRNKLITLIPSRALVSVALLSISKYTNNIRKRHIRAIEGRQNYFGIERERLDILRFIRKSLADSLKLYIATVVVIAILTFIGIIELILNEGMLAMKLIFILILHIIDVAVIASTQGEIRIQMKLTFRMCCYRYVAGQNVVSPNVGA